MADTTVKFFTPDMQGAPALNGAAGYLTDLLDAVLVDGFGSRTITSASITAGVCTLGFTSSAAQPLDSVVLVAGCTPATGTLNGRQKVTASSGTSLSFATAATGAVTTSSPTVKTAPLGWTKAYTGTNKRAYKASAPEATGLYLRVDDTGAQRMLVQGYETMADVDTGTGPFPTSAISAAAGQTGGGYSWWKDTGSGTTGIPWFLVGDDGGFFLCIAPYKSVGATNLMRSIYFFGDINSVKSGDAFGCLLTGQGDDASDASKLVNLANVTPASSGSCLARLHNGIGAAVSTMRTLGPYPAAIGSGSSSWYTQYPNPVNNGLVAVDMEILTGAASGGGAHLRGTLPGMKGLCQAVGVALQSGDRITGTDDFAGRTLVAMRCSASPGGQVTDPAAPGAVLFDVTGPWR